MASLSSTGPGAILFSQTFPAANNTSITVTLSAIAENDRAPVSLEEILGPVATKVDAVSSIVIGSSRSVLPTCPLPGTSSHASTSILHSQNCMDSVERTEASVKTVRFTDNIPVSRDISKLENVNLGIKGCETLITRDNDLNQYPADVQIKLQKVNQGLESLKASFERIKGDLTEYSSKDIDNYIYSLVLLIFEKQSYTHLTARERGLSVASESQQSSHISSSSSSDVRFRDSDAARIGIIVKTLQRIPKELSIENFLAKNAVQEYNKERILFIKLANHTIDYIDETELIDIIKIIILADKLKKSHERVFALEAILKERERIPKILNINLFVGLAKYAAKEYNRKRKAFIIMACTQIQPITITPEEVETVVKQARKLEDYRETVFRVNQLQLNLLGKVSYTKPPIQAKNVRKINDEKSLEKRKKRFN